MSRFTIAFPDQLSCLKHPTHHRQFYSQINNLARMESDRQQKEVLLKTLAIHFTTVVAMGHLNSLRKVLI